MELMSIFVNEETKEGLSRKYSGLCMILNFFIPYIRKPRPRLRTGDSREHLLDFAIRISKNAYVISGGAIKLVRKMEDHPDTRNELKKLELVKSFLQSIGLFNEDDLKPYEL